MRSLGPSVGSANILITGVDSAQMGSIRETLGTEAVLPATSVDYIQAFDIVGRGRTNVVIVGFDIFKSYWPLDVSFPIFMANLIDYFTQVSKAGFRPVL